MKPNPLDLVLARGTILALPVLISLLVDSPLQGRGAEAVEFGYAGGVSASYAPLDHMAFGWEFSTSKPVLFTHWGLFTGLRNAGSANPIGGTNRLALWTTSGTLLGSSMMTYSTPSQEAGAFRFAPTAPFILPAGHYVISVQGSTNGSPRIVGGLDLVLTSAPPVAYVAARYTDRRTNDSPWFPDIVAPTNRSLCSHCAGLR